MFAGCRDSSYLAESRPQPGWRVFMAVYFFHTASMKPVFSSS
jgi:hypothetical protein